MRLFGIQCTKGAFLGVLRDPDACRLEVDVQLVAPSSAEFGPVAVEAELFAVDRGDPTRAAPALRPARVGLKDSDHWVAACASGKPDRAAVGIGGLAQVCRGAAESPWDMLDLCSRIGGRAQARKRPGPPSGPSVSLPLIVAALGPTCVCNTHPSCRPCITQCSVMP